MTISSVGVDMAKLCDYRYELGLRDPLRVHAVLKRARELALKSYPDVIYPFARHSTTPKREDWEVGPFNMLGQPTWIGALASLCDSVRALKSAIRRVLRGWDTLHGEVELDELIIISVLAETYPPALELLRELGTSFGMGARGERDAVLNQERQNTIKALWHRYVPDNTAIKDPLEQLMARLLPQCRLQGNSSDALMNAQRVRYKRPTGYRERIINEDIVEADLRDQVFLRHLQQWQQKGAANEEFSRLLAVDERYGEKIEQFEYLVTEEQRLTLASQVLNVLRAQYGCKANAYMPGFLPLWRCVLHQNPRRSLVDLLINEIERSLAVSLRLTNDLYYYWVNTKENLVTREEKQQIRKRVIQLAREHFCDKPDSAQILLQALDKDFPYSLYHLIFTTERGEAGEDASLFRRASDWVFISGTLILGMQTQPAVLIPQVAALIAKTDRGDPFDPRPAEIDQAVCDELFGQSVRELFVALANEFPMSTAIPPEIAKLIREIQAAARLRF
ncbi:MAG TPA: hypothetical protein VGP72_21635 [Planctomycetota bacterium]|jgi:hypothetical protein